MRSELSLSRRTEAMGVVVILALAAVLRLGWPGLTEFKGDEARLLALALDMAQGQGVALRGISSSVGFPNFPMSVWLYALPAWIWPHVYSATLFTGLLNSLAVAAAYWFVRRYWGVRAALAAALLLAVSPWAVIFSRKIWAQNLLPLFVMGWVISGALAFVDRRPKFIVLHLLFLAVAIQIHLAAVTLAVVTAVYLLIFWRRIEWKWLLAGGLAGLGTAVPFLIYLWQNQDKAALPGGSTSTTALDGQPFQLLARLSLGTDIHSLAGPDAFTDYLAQVPDMTAVHVLWGVLIVGGIVLMINDLRLTINRQSSIVNRQTDVGLMVLLWLIVPPLFFTWRFTPVYIHYFIATLPAQYIAAGVGFSWFIGWLVNGLAGRRWGVVLSWVVLVGTAVLQTWVFVALLFFVGERETPGGFGVPVVRQLAAVERAQMMLAETGAAEILAIGPGESPRVDEFPAVYDVLLRGLPHRFVDINRSALFPADATVILLDGDEGVADLYRETAVSTALSASSTQQEIPLRTGEGSLYVLTLPPNAVPQAEVTFETPYLLANWVNLLGYDEPVLQNDGTAVWQIYWRTGDNPDPASYQIFNHVIDNTGQRVSQVDGPAFSPAQWQAGDVVVSRFVLPWPEGLERPYTIRTGMYRYPSLEPVLLLDVAGNPFSDAVDIEIGR